MFSEGVLGMLILMQFIVEMAIAARQTMDNMVRGMDLYIISSSGKYLGAVYHPIPGPHNFIAAGDFLLLQPHARHG